MAQLSSLHPCKFDVTWEQLLELPIPALSPVWASSSSGSDLARPMGSKENENHLLHRAFGVVKILCGSRRRIVGTTHRLMGIPGTSDSRQTAGSSIETLVHILQSRILFVLIFSLDPDVIIWEGGRAGTSVPPYFSSSLHSPASLDPSENHQKFDRELLPRYPPPRNIRSRVLPTKRMGDPWLDRQPLMEPARVDRIA